MVSQSSDTKDIQIAKLQEDILSLERKIESCTQTEHERAELLQVTKGKLTDARDMITHKDEHISSLELKIDHLEEHLDDVTAVVKETEIRKSELESALSVVDPNNNAEEIHRLQKELKEVKLKDNHRLNELEALKQSVLTQSTQIKDELDAQISQHQESITTIENLESQHEGLKGENQTLEAKWNDAKDAVSELKQLKQQFQQVTNAKKEAEGNLDEELKKVDTLGKECEELKAKTEELKEELASMTTQKEAAETRVHQLEESTVASDALAAKAKECASLKSEKDKIKKDLETFQNLSRSQKDVIEQKESLWKTAEDDKQKLTNKLTDLERNNANLQKSLDNIKKSSEEKSKDAKSKAAENKELRYKKNKMEKEVERLNEQISDMNKPLELANKKHVKKIEELQQSHKSTVTKLKEKQKQREKQIKGKNTIIMRGYTDHQYRLALFGPAGGILLLVLLNYLFHSNAFAR